jgi:hypothetical protein
VDELIADRLSVVLGNAEKRTEVSETFELAAARTSGVSVKPLRKGSATLPSTAMDTSSLIVVLRQDAEVGL